MSFWTLREVTPKLKDRFIVLINNQIHINAKSVNKPTLTFENKEYRMINHYFKYPGLPNIAIQQISPGGIPGDIPKVVEQWTLINPIIRSLSWGDLAYGDDGLVEYELELDYDYAEISSGHRIFGSSDADAN